MDDKIKEKFGRDHHVPFQKQGLTMTPLTEQECRQLLSNYNTALTCRIDGHRSKNSAKDLLELDSWRLNDLSNAVRGRNPSFMTKEELEKLMDCKLYSHFYYIHSC